MSKNYLLALHLKQTFPPIIWIFTEGDGIQTRLPFKIVSTLILKYLSNYNLIINDKSKASLP